MTQVIQGSNLRLLFADNPPSMIGVGPQAGAGAWGSPNPGMYHPGYEPNAYNGYQSYGGRPGYGGGYGGPPLQQMQYPMQYPRSQGYIRDEILMVSDDKVFALRTNYPEPQHVMSDSASMISNPR